ncbi:MAG: transposase [Ilumatobacter sp.]
MARARDLTSSTVFHVLNRGVDRQDIVWQDTDRELFLDVLGDRSGRHDVGVLAYALMSNHYHLVVEVTDGDLAAMMRDFQSAHARAINRRLNRTGPLFEYRYTSVPVVSDAQLAVAVRYVHRNPIDIVGTDGLAAYQWSSLGPSIGGRPGPDWFRLELLERRIELTDHLSYVVAPLPSDRRPVAWISPQRRTTLAEVVRAVDAVVPPAGARASVLALICAELRACEPALLAALLGCSQKRVRNLRASAKALLVDRPDFAALVNATLLELG